MISKDLLEARIILALLTPSICQEHPVFLLCNPLTARYLCHNSLACLATLSLRKSSRFETDITKYRRIEEFDLNNIMKKT